MVGLQRFFIIEIIDSQFKCHVNETDMWSLLKYSRDQTFYEDRSSIEITRYVCAFN